MRIAMLGVKGIPHPSGVENVVENLGSRLAERGHEVWVYVRPFYTPPSLKEYRGMRLINLPSVHKRSLDALSHTFLAAMHATSHGVDIAHFHSIGVSSLSLIPRSRGIKTVAQSHGLDWQRAKWGKLAKTFLKISDYSMVNFPSASTVVSKKLKRYYEAKFGRPVMYIPNGVDDFPAVPPREMLDVGLARRGYILFAARLVPEKGCHYLLEAYRRLGNPSKKLVVAGDSNYGDHYAEELKKHASDNILFPGFVRGRLFQELMSNAYVYVQPSEIEGLSMSLLEAMSYGNCVLASDIEENVEAVADAGTYFTCSDARSLEEQLRSLLDDETLTAFYRSKAKQRSKEQFNWDMVADEYERLYASLLEPASKPVPATAGMGEAVPVHAEASAAADGALPVVVRRRVGS